VNNYLYPIHSHFEAFFISHAANKEPQARVVTELRPHLRLFPFVSRVYADAVVDIIVEKIFDESLAKSADSTSD